MEKVAVWKRPVTVLGCGGVSQCVLPLLLDLIDVDPASVTIIDMVDNSHRMKAALARGVKYVQHKITEENLLETLEKFVVEGSLLIDLAYSIDTVTLLDWCHDRDVLYVNTSVEEWDPYAGVELKEPAHLTLYARQMRLRELIEKWEGNQGPTAVVDHGANPGLVSHFVHEALETIAKTMLEDRNLQLTERRRELLKKALAAHDYAQLAWHIGLKTIHISERDSQITCKPKEVNEFLNTWSPAGFIEEGIAPAEVGWGTHEKKVPWGAMEHGSGPQNQILLPTMGCNTLVRSWVPSGPIIGMVIRHGEAFSLSENLAVWAPAHTRVSTSDDPSVAEPEVIASPEIDHWSLDYDDKKCVYRPTVHYAYCCADAAWNSLHELNMRDYDPQPRLRCMNDDIINGTDELGCLLLGHDYGAWWIGSVLDIHEARKLAPGQNATTLQVAISVVAAVAWMIKNPARGLCLPDHLDSDFILKISKPFLGKFFNEKVHWSPIGTAKDYLKYGREKPRHDEKYQFSTFLVKTDNYSRPPAVSKVHQKHSKPGAPGSPGQTHKHHAHHSGHPHSGAQHHHSSDHHESAPHGNKDVL